MNEASQRHLWSLSLSFSKMQEYITGRGMLNNIIGCAVLLPTFLSSLHAPLLLLFLTVDLSLRNIDKAITTTGSKNKKKDNADRDLKFIVNSDGRYEVVAVPPQMGIRAGSVVLGVATQNDPKRVRPIVDDDHMNIRQEINLGQLAKMHRINLGRADSKGNIAEQGNILVFEKKVKYCTHLIKLDTKDYGLPQTRNRKYLFLWRSDDPTDDLGDYFEKIMDHLKVSICYPRIWKSARHHCK
jgi:hypothetical protein